MMFRDFIDEDYPTIKSWWEGHHGEGEGPALKVLSTDGLIIEDLCAAWIYTTNSKIAIVGWPVGNPTKKGKPVYEGLALVVDGLKAIARSRGAEAVTAYTNHSGLLKLFKSLDFQVADEHVTNLIARI